MRAALFEAPETIQVGEVPLPGLGPGDVLLRVRSCGICGSDLSLYKTGALAGPGVILGHEISAVIEADPAGAWQPGTRVSVYPWGEGCGRCVWCREGRYRYCLDPPPRYGGGFATHTRVPARTLLEVPDGVSDEAAALAEPLGVAVRAAALAEAKPGDLAYVSGLGSIGLLCVAVLAEAGCTVVGADPRSARRARAMSLGCSAALDNTAKDPAPTLMGLDDHGPAIALECAGVPDSLQQCIDACAPEGVIGILGIPMAPVFLLRMTLREQRAFSIQGPSPETMRRALRLLVERPALGAVITRTVPLDGTDAAFRDLLRGDGPDVKVLVSPGA